MSEPSPPPTWHIVALIARAGGPEILVQDGLDSPTLPTAPGRLAIEPFEADALAADEALIASAVVPIRLTWLPEEAH